MKTNKFSKILLLVLSLVLVLGATFAMSINAAEATTKPEIISQNVFYTDKFQLMFAVDAATVAEGDVKLYVYDTHPSNIADTSTIVPLVETTATAGSESGLGKNAYIFKITGVGAADMLQEFYVQAEDAAGNKSDVKKYSIAEYLYERLAGAKTISADQKEFYLNTINFGSKAQALFGVEGETLLSDYSYLYVNGAAKGIVPAGKKLNPYVDAIGADWNVTITDEDGKETVLELQEKSFTVPSNAIKTVATPVNKISYTTGFENMNTWALGQDTWDSNKISSHGTFIKESGAPAVEYIKDSERGVVAKITGNTGWIMKFSPNSTVSAGDATAFEFSFDVKINYDGSDDGKFQFRFYTGSSRITETNIYSGPSYTEKLYIGSNGGSKHGNLTITNTSPAEWHHVRVVKYFNASDAATKDLNSYIYIDGSDTPIVETYSMNSYDGDISKITEAAFRFHSGTGKMEVYFDNFFCGYTTDTLN